MGVGWRQTAYHYDMRITAACCSLCVCRRVIVLYRAGLVVTETLDSGLLGEHVINTLCDAWTRLIDTDSEVVSMSVCVYSVVICFMPVMLVMYGCVMRTM